MLPWPPNCMYGASIQAQSDGWVYGKGCCNIHGRARGSDKVVACNATKDTIYKRRGKSADMSRLSRKLLFRFALARDGLTSLSPVQGLLATACKHGDAPEGSHPGGLRFIGSDRGEPTCSTGLRDQHPDACMTHTRARELFEATHLHAARPPAPTELLIFSSR